MDLLEHQAKTVAVKSCASCGSGLLERDKFCRWCGVPQLDQWPETQQTVAASLEACRYTASLTTAARADVYHRVSGPLVNAAVSGALAGPPTEIVSPMVKRAILALISIPIWLIIVLLSRVVLAAFETLVFPCNRSRKIFLRKELPSDCIDDVTPQFQLGPLY